MMRAFSKSICHAFALVVMMMSCAPIVVTAFTVVSPSTSTKITTTAVEPWTKNALTTKTTSVPFAYRSKGQPLFMSWGPEPIWATASLVSNVPACPSKSCVLLQVQVSDETAAAYRVPGQYVQLQSDKSEKPIYLAMASPPPPPAADDEGKPSSTVLEFLVQRTDNNGWLCDAEAGAALQVSQILGNGFDLAGQFDSLTAYDFPVQNVLLFATGTGIAPLKAAMESGQLMTATPAGGNSIVGKRTARLYYGETSPEEMAYTNLFATWEALGIEVVPVYSQNDPASGGRSGYVQTALEEDGIAIPRNTGALLCGVKGMTQAVKELLVQAGVFEGRVLFNY